MQENAGSLLMLPVKRTRQQLVCCTIRAGEEYAAPQIVGQEYGLHPGTLYRLIGDILKLKHVFSRRCLATKD
jgi:hypothetical protein